MVRDDVLDVVLRTAAEIVPGFNPTEVDTTKSLKDYGMSSLDLVELVSEAMREMRVKVPRAELSKITNIDGLVDLLQAASSKAQI